MKLLFDFDDVLNDLSRCWVQELNRSWHTSVKWDDVTAYDLRVSFPEIGTMELYRPYLDGTLYLDTHPDPEARALLEALSAEHEIYLATSNLLGVDAEYVNTYLFEPKETTGETRHILTVDYLLQFLAEYYPMIRQDHILLTTDKSMLRGDALIDDNPEHLTRFRGLRILLDKPYNRAFDTERHNIYRAKTYPDIARIIKENTV